jgi:hypothetical protein
MRVPAAEVREPHQVEHLADEAAPAAAAVERAAGQRERDGSSTASRQVKASTARQLP